MGHLPSGKNPHPPLRDSRGDASASLEGRPPEAAYALPQAGEVKRARHFLVLPRSLTASKVWNSTL
uniref:Uncharacterized protein n=1 Tax=Bradyrhizobium amphicarpaeae TaxID=1404768 RepID=A0A2U8PX51_9BRAD|nr:hypothetical protein CIT40_21740 [Bradyrhizobium amphicarpaeae]